MNHEEEDDDEVDTIARCCEWDFTHLTTLSPTPPSSSSDVIGAIETNPSNSILATAGIARKIRIYTLNPYFYQFYIFTPAKLSSLRFHPLNPSLLAAADYDGVVTEYDFLRRVPVTERVDDHDGRKIWTVDYSPDASLAVSGSDDGNAVLWDPRSGSRSAAIPVGAAVCSAEFEKANGRYLGVGCADKRAYVYDVRNVSAAVGVLTGHRKTVTYVRFDGEGRVVTSATDGSHRLWEGYEERRVYRGHENGRSFVGMGVWRRGGGGLIGCGSESNEVFVYDLRWGRPVWVRRFGGGEEGFVSAVCWREVGEEEFELVAGGSDGVLQVFNGTRRK